MKSIGIFAGLLGLIAIGTSSCYSPQFMADDDVYVVKESALPVGESLNNPTSYSAFRNNKNNRSISSTYYNDLNNFPIGSNYFSSSYWLLGMGFYNPYFRNYAFGIPYCSPYMFGGCSPVYMIDPFGSMYGFYPISNYPMYYGGNYFFGNSYGYYNNYNNYNSYGTGFNNYGGATTAYNFHSGPRGTLSGAANPGGRSTGPVVLKSSSPISSNARPEMGRIDVNHRIAPLTNNNTSPSIQRPVSQQQVNSRFTPSDGRVIRSNNPTPSSIGRTIESPGRIDNAPSNRGGSMHENSSPRGTGGTNVGGGSGGGSGRSGSNSGGGTGRRN